MNSAADLKRLHEQTALQKAKDKVIDALKNDPLGLSANQLMTVCRLSIKTVKNILATIDVQEEHGVYFLSGVARAEISTEPQAEQVTTVVQVKAHDAILQYLHDFPAGLTNPELMAALQLNDKQFTNGIYKLKNEGEIIRTGKFGSYKYQLKTNGQEMNTEVIAAPAAEENVIQVQPALETPAQDPQPSEPDAIALLKDQIKTVVTTKNHLTIKEDQLSELLSSVFGLNTVNFCVEGSRLVGVHLSQFRTPSGYFFSDPLKIDVSWEAWQAAKAQAVPEGFVLVPVKEIKEWYLDESENIYREDPDWLCDISIGDVVEVEHRVSYELDQDPVFAAIQWDDKNGDVGYYEIFKSKAEAEKVAAHCKAMIEAQEPAK